MFVEVSLLRELFLADETYKRFFSIVDSHMIDDVALLPKASIASLITTEELLNCSVGIFVLLKPN